MAVRVLSKEYSFTLKFYRLVRVYWQTKSWVYCGVYIVCYVWISLDENSWKSFENGYENVGPLFSRSQHLEQPIRSLQLFSRHGF